MTILSEDEALSFVDLIYARMLGWSVVLGIVNGRRDFRRRQTREAADVMTDLLLNMPGFDELVAAIVRGDDIVALWPEALQETLRFQINHKVPRTVNEPTARDKASGCRLLAPFLADHGVEATVEDHPPLPPRSALFLASKAAA